MNLLLTQNTFDKLYDDLNKFASLTEQKAVNFTQILVHAIEIVENWSKSVVLSMVVHGLQKKELVISLMTQFSSKLSDEKDKFEIHVKFFMDKLIDVLISAAKGQLSFNEIKEITTQCCLKSNSKQPKKLKIKSSPKDVSEVESIVDQVYDNIKTMIVNKQFNVSSFVMLITMVMQALEQLPQLTGPEKKDVAIKVIKKLILEIPIPGIDSEAAGVIIDTSLNTTIDFIISAANGEFDFGKIITEVKGWFSCCKKQ